MASFNLLNTGVLTAASVTAPFLGKYPGSMTTKQLNELELARLLSADELSSARAEIALAQEATSTTKSALEQAGLGTNVSVDDSVQGDEVVVVANRTDTVDNRLRLSALRGREVQIYGPNDKTSNILSPLYSTGGMMFPFTPSVQISGDTDWAPHALTHTNYDIHSYQRTPSATITLSGKFTVQNQREGEYALACIHFLRTVGKMYYGEQDSADYDPRANDQTTSNAGLPPPVLRLRGYGSYMFDDLRCVLKGYSFSFDENMDLVNVFSQTGGDILLPPMFSITVNLLLQQNPSRLRKEFKLDDFRTGALMRKSSGLGGWF